ncbi:MAG TPA: hypothetical protein VGG98_01655 [Solirubrobacteraceae bacterium]|jgi:hypothetical protein
MSLRVGIPAAIVALLAVALSACGASAQNPGADLDTGGRAARTASAGAVLPGARVLPGAQVASGGRAVAGAPCGTAAAEVLATSAGAVARRIYAGEVGGTATIADKHQVERYAPLLEAIAAGNRSAVKAAVTSLVFSHTHLVRLRVTHGSTVLADVGGPYILAPVTGTLRLHGRALARYVMSVQDDLGYVKLVTRFIGAPIVLRAGSHAIPIEGVLTPGPASIPTHGPVTYRHTAYEAYSFDGTAFPSGSLRVSLLLPVPSSLSKLSCAEIETAELGIVAQRISRRFPHLSPASLPPYTRLTRTLTGGLVYVRSGSRQLAGSTSPGPSRLPDRGSVRYRGRTYGVSSFSTRTSVGQVRVYLLVRA